MLRLIRDDDTHVKIQERLNDLLHPDNQSKLFEYLKGVDHTVMFYTPDGFVFHKPKGLDDGVVITRL